MTAEETYGKIDTDVGPATWHSARVRAVPFEALPEFYRHVQAQGSEAIRWLALRDRYFLLTCVLGHTYAANRWVFDRCREVESATDGYLDLWSRFHFKSTVITMAGAIQEILRNPEITVCVLSYNNATAQKFVDQIRRELEKPVLTALFPDVLWSKPPQLNWSVQKGLTVRRKGNPKEPTICGYGLVDAEPTGSHFMLRIYDDVVVPASVSSPEQIRKTTEAWERSIALGTEKGGREWYVGTRYHSADTYAEIMRRNAAVPRIRLCEDAEGAPTLMDAAALAALKAKMGPYTYAAQMLQNPLAAGMRTFRDEWWNVCLTFPPRRAMRVGIIIDSANAKRKSSDYTTMWVVGLAPDRNYYLLDGVHDRMNLIERTKALFKLVKAWRPECVFWEQVGAMSDVAHVRFEQDLRGWHFSIEELRQTIDKDDRIRWLQPTFSTGRIWVPARMLRQQVDGETRDIILDFFNDEFSTHPVCRHKDMIDCLANIHHPTFTRLIDFPDEKQQGAGAYSAVAGSRARDVWDPLKRR